MDSSSPSIPQLLPTETNSQSGLTAFSLGSCSSSIAHQFSNRDRNLTIVTSSGPNTLILNQANGQLKSVLPFPFHILEEEREAAGNADGDGGEEQQQVQLVGIGSCQEDDQQLVFSISSSLIAFYSATFSSTSTSNQSYRLHSTLLLPLSAPILTASLFSSYLLIGTTDFITIYKSTLDSSRQTTWRQIWKKRTPDRVRKVEFLSREEESSSSSEKDTITFAALCENDDRVLVFDFNRKISDGPNGKMDQQNREGDVASKRKSKSRREIKPKVTNRLIHSREVVDFTWRKSEEKDSPQVLVTHTMDGVAKVWMSVIDEPSILKLWSSMDLSGWGDDSFNSSSKSDSKGKSSINRSSCPSFYLDSKALNHSIKTSLNLLDQELQMMELGIHEISDSSNQSTKNDQEKLLEKKKTRKKRLEHILNDSKDLFLRIMKNDEICIKALVNLDRKPPTLCESFTVLHLKSDSKAETGSIAEEKKDIGSLHLLPLIPNSGGKDNSSTKANAVLSGIKSTSSRTAGGRSSSFQIEMEMGGLFDGDMNALNIKRKELKSSSFKFDSTSDPVSWEHSRSIRTIMRDHSGKRALTISEGSKSSKEKDEIEMVFWGAMGEKEDLSCGLGLAQSTSLRVATDFLGEKRVTLLPHALGVAQLTSPTSIAVFSKSDPLELPISVSSNDQIVLITSSPSTVGDAACLLSAITSKKEAFVWEIEFSSSTRCPDFRLVDQSSLPQSQDQNGHSEIFIIDQSLSLSFGYISSNGIVEVFTFTSSRWKCSSKINTSRENVSLVKANSSGVLAIVSSAESGSELSIWNSREADFCSGLEHLECFEENIEALDWSSHGIEKGKPLLAVAFSSKVKIYSPTRLEDGIPTRLKNPQGWEVVSEIDVATLTPNKINALNFFPNTQLLVASSNQIMSFGPYLNHYDREQKPLFQLVEDKSGNLRQYHPIMIRECLKWGKIEVAKKILVNLWNSLKHQSFDHQVVGNEKDIQTIEEIEYIRVQQVHHDHFMKEEERRSDASLESRDLFVEGSDDLDDSESFSSSTASKLLQKLKASHLHLRGLALTEQEILDLRSMIQTVSEVDEQRQTLDINGLQYLASLKSFMISQSILPEASKSTVQSNLTFGSANSSSPPKSSSLPRLSSRDTLWAFHSSSQELLTSNLSQSLSNKLNWSAARSTGLFLWIKDISLLKIQAEEVAKAQYMSGEDRDPVSCSLLYYALGKHKLVLGLWKQAAWHPEQKKMLAFLKNDFEEQRWKTASKKNAFALLSQRRFEFAAVFFMLGDALQDAVNVVVRHLEDLDLAIALTRIKQGDDGPVFQDLIKNRVLPKSIEEGDRATSSWAFWKLGRKDLAIQVLMKPLYFILQEPKMNEILSPESFASLLKARTSKASFESTSVYHSDPSLVLILAQLKEKAPLAFQSVEGTSAEWDYVLHVNRMLIRMGCPLLGLSMLRNWSFHLPSSQIAEVVDSSSTQAATASLDPASISSTLNSSLVIDGSKEKVSHLGEASSISHNDSSFLDVSSSSIRPFPPGTSTIFESVPPSESGSVILPAKEESVKEKDEEVGAKAVKKTGLGSLMKEAKSSTKQGAQEFSFDSFGF